MPFMLWLHDTHAHGRVEGINPYLPILGVAPNPAPWGPQRGPSPFPSVAALLRLGSRRAPMSLSAQPTYYLVGNAPSQATDYGVINPAAVSTSLFGYVLTGLVTVAASKTTFMSITLA